MTNTYTMTATNGEMPKVTVEFSCDMWLAMSLAKIAEEAFRDVRVVSDDTGEVMYNRYFATEAYAPQRLVTEVLDNLSNLYWAAMEMRES